MGRLNQKVSNISLQLYCICIVSIALYISPFRYTLPDTVRTEDALRTMFNQVPDDMCVVVFMDSLDQLSVNEEVRRIQVGYSALCSINFLLLTQSGSLLVRRRC